MVITLGQQYNTRGETHRDTILYTCYIKLLYINRYVGTPRKTKTNYYYFTILLANMIKQDTIQLEIDTAGDKVLLSDSYHYEANLTTTR